MMATTAAGRWGGAGTVAGLALAALASLCAAPATAQDVTALVGGTLVDGNGGAPVSDAVVVVSGDRIVCAGPRRECAVPDGARVVDAVGKWVTPGLVDAHVHFSQTGWMDGRPDGLPAPDLFPYIETSRENRDNPERWQRSYLCTGITAVFDVGGHPWSTALPETFEGNPRGTHVRAAGPLVTFANRPELQADDEMYTFLPMSSDAEALESVARVAAMGSTALKVWYLRVPPAQRDAMDRRLMAMGDAAREAGLDLIVHATGLREAKAALRAGATLLVHSVEDQLVDEEFLALARQNGTVYAPTLVVGENWARAMISVVMDTPQATDDPNGCVDPGTAAKIHDTASLQAYLPDQLRGNLEYGLSRMTRVGGTQAVMAENLRRVRDAGITVATATDAGNPLTLHGPSIYNEMEAMQAAGIPAPEVVVMSTRNGAHAMERLDDFGTVEAGKIADLLLLSEDPTRDVRAFRTLTHVMRAGVLHEQASLAWRPAS